jgi:hypothetical protein
MPEEHEERDLNVGNGILGPEDEGSMAFKLARAVEAQPQLSEEELEAARQADLANDQAGGGEGDAEAEAAAVAAASAAATAAPETPQPKYQTVEEYEKAYKEAETRMHTATGETATERKAREAAEARAEAAERELAELKTAREAATAEAAKPAAKAERVAAYAEALKKIQAIPTDVDPETGAIIYPENYDDLVAEAWAGTAVDPEQIIEEVARRTEAREAEKRAAAEAKAAEEAEVAEAATVRSRANKMATDLGLDMTPGSAEYRLFYSHVDELAANPEHEFYTKPFEEQVKWATNGVRQTLGKKIEMTDAERAAARRTQTRNAVLERGVTRVAPAEPKKQRSMQEILGQTPL